MNEQVTTTAPYLSAIITGATAVVAAFVGFASAVWIEGVRRRSQVREVQRTMLGEYLAFLAGMLRNREESVAILLDIKTMESKAATLTDRAEAAVLLGRAQHSRTRMEALRDRMASERESQFALHYQLNLLVSTRVSRVASIVFDEMGEFDKTFLARDMPEDDAAVTEGLRTVRNRVTDLVVIARATVHAPGARSERAIYKRLKSELDL